MKKRIMVFMLLFALLVEVVPVLEARADEEYSIYELCSFLSDDIINSLNTHPYVMAKTPNGYYYLLVFYNSEEDSSRCGGKLVTKEYGITACSYSDYYSYSWRYVLIDETWTLDGSDYSYVISGDSTNGIYPTVLVSSFDKLYLQSNSSVIIQDNLVKIDGYLPYLFINWCVDASLNCVASSNETEDLYNFSYDSEDYHYMVRKNRVSGSEYTWYLSQVTLEEDLIYYSTNRALADSTIGAADLNVLSGEYATGSTHVRNYVYDSSGGGWLYTDNYSVDLGLTNEYYVDDIGITYSSSMPIVYSDVDIYSNKEQSSVYYAANTEYEDSEVTYPDISPTSTPTPTPIINSGSSGSGSSSSGIVVGGQAKSGGLMELALYFISWVWTDLFAIEVPVDGYQISMQQVFIYGAIVAVLIWAVFGRKKG